MRMLSIIKEETARGEILSSGKCGYHRTIGAKKEIIIDCDLFTPSVTYNKLS